VILAQKRIFFLCYSHEQNATERRFKNKPMAHSSNGSPAQPTTSSRGVTLNDVARAAGVTLGTASKALNGRGKLSIETRERVRAEAKRLGFRFRELRQEEIASSGLLIGVLTTDNYGRFSMPLVTGIEDSFGPLPVSVVLCNSHDLEREQQHIDLLVSRGANGIIVTARREDVRPPIDVGRTPLPVVYAFTQVADGNALCILPDEIQGTRLAIEHLIQIGRRHFAHITGPGYFEAVRVREQAMRQVLAEHGLRLPEHQALSGPWQESWGYTAARYLFDQNPAIDALFCGSDQLARGASDALRERGIRVPDDVSIVGFDNWEPIANACRPPLTTIDMNIAQIGRYAGESLQALFAGEFRAGVVHLPCSLVIRASSVPDERERR
jgi:LacI family transcriptional regulator